MTAPDVAFQPVSPDNPDAVYCLGRYFDELRQRFEDGFDPALSAAPSLEGFAPPDGIFVVGYLAGRPVACGGFKRLDASTAYVKRMWVDSSCRGLGVGRKLLNALETRGVEAGFGRLVLDTHRSLTEAKTLYLRSGYREIAPLLDEPYGDHWFEKSLSAK